MGGSCAKSQFTFEYPVGGMITQLDSIKVGAPYALYGSTVTFDNKQAEGVKVIAIECGQGNCAGATFVFNNADYGDIKCAEMIDGGCGPRCFVEIQGSGGNPATSVTCDQVSTT